MRELTRILETEKVIAWILLNMWRLEPVTDTKVGINVPNKYNFKAISLQVLQLFSFTRFSIHLCLRGEGGRCEFTNPHPRPRLK